MAKKDLKKLVEDTAIKADRINSFKIGDTVDVHVKIVEGEKERIQIFNGIVIAKKGHGTNEAFTVRRLVGTEGVERVWPLHTPTIDKIEVKKSGKTRRAKLYYLRDRVGKATRLAEEQGESIKPRAAAEKAAAAKKEKEAAKA
jgi:large subunit ribosomal protein L19